MKTANNRKVASINEKSRCKIIFDWNFEAQLGSWRVHAERWPSGQQVKQFFLSTNTPKVKVNYTFCARSPKRHSHIWLSTSKYIYYFNSTRITKYLVAWLICRQTNRWVHRRVERLLSLVLFWRPKTSKTPVSITRF